MKWKEYYKIDQQTNSIIEKVISMWVYRPENRDTWKELLDRLIQLKIILHDYLELDKEEK